MNPLDNSRKASREVRIIPLQGLPEIAAGDDIGSFIAGAIREQKLRIANGDIFVVAQKIVSKAEGRIVELATVEPSNRAVDWAAAYRRDARVIELVLREAARIVKMERGVIIAETKQGLVCANAGVDCSNTPPGTATLLPEDADGSAQRLREKLGKEFGADVAVIISDTFGRPWREGIVNVALGVAGISPLIDYRGRQDASGNTLQMTVVALADELASAAELVMGKMDGVPVAIIRGVKPNGRGGSGRDLIRLAENDLFR